jgi:hypothetical protein
MEKHSMAMLVSLLWARDNMADDDWQSAAKYFWNAFFTESVANAIPAAGDRAAENNIALTVMQEAIAYSATGLGTGLDICGVAQQSRRGAAFRFNRREMTA